MLAEGLLLRNCYRDCQLIANFPKIAIMSGQVFIPFSPTRCFLMQMSCGGRPRIVSPLKSTLWLVTVCLLSCSPAWGQVPRHAHEATGSTGPSPDSAPGDAATGQQEMDHAGHDMDQEDAGKSAHVHPDPSKVDDGSVGLEENLGGRIPLDLTFRDEQGNPVRLDELVTLPTVIAPVYYRCPNVCHFLQGDLARVLPQLKLEPGEDFRVLSISFDDTESAALARRSKDTYFTAMQTDFPAGAWRFLTGDNETIHALTDAAGYYFKRAQGEFLHPVAFFVVSPDGTIVRYLHGTHVLPKDLTLALYEAKEGRIGTTIRKVVQYCFSYDPENKTYVFNVLRVSATVILTTLVLFLAFLVWGGKKSKKDSRS